MHILDQKQVAQQKDESDAQRQERTRSINEEETKAVKKLNETREYAERETARINSDLAKYEESSIAKITTLTQEVEALEARKKEALKPIHEARIEAENKLFQADKRTIELDAREAGLTEREQNLAERSEAIIDREAENTERSQKLDAQESGAKAEEARIKQSQDKLAVEWANFHQTVHAANNRLIEREKAIEDGRRANEIVMESNRIESARLVQERKAIQDGYVALEQAKVHLGIK